MSTTSGSIENPYKRMLLRRGEPFKENDSTEVIPEEPKIETEINIEDSEYKEGITEETKKDVDEVMDRIDVPVSEQDDKDFFKTATRGDVVNKYKDSVTKLLEGTGIHPETFFAQMIHESGIYRFGDQTQLGAGIRKGFNPFNLKQYSKSGIDSTYEHVDDDVDFMGTPIASNFIKYDTIEEGFQGYIDFLLRNPRYKKALSASTPEEQIELIANSGFAGGVTGEEANTQYRTDLLTILEKDINPVLRVVLGFKKGGLIYTKCNSINI